MRCGGTNHRRNSFHRRTLTFNNHCLLFSLKSRTIKINTESGKPDATYVVDWGAEDNVDGAIEDDDKTKYTFTSGTLVSLYNFFAPPIYIPRMASLSLHHLPPRRKCKSALRLTLRVFASGE